MYKVLRNFLFLFPPEWVHYFSMNCLRVMTSTRLGRNIVTSMYSPARSNQKLSLWNLEFRNPVGLGAGFDKNVRYLKQLDALGFGFIEIGTITPLPQAGNDKPRLFRLPKDKALINRMGFNNAGATIAAEKLRQWRESSLKNTNRPQLIIGGNIGKNKNTANEDAWQDYAICFRALHPYVDYFVVNVSSPNTPGLRELQEKDSLLKILSHLQTINTEQPLPKPLLLKIAPDLSTEQLDDVIALAMEIKLDGLVAANTTISRDGLKSPAQKVKKIGAGGLSGLPLKSRSTSIVRYVYEKTGGRLPVIASGGIFTGEDAKEKQLAGASLVQVWTGFIYEGPSIVRKICKTLQG